MKIETLKFGIDTEAAIFCIVFFPVAKYERVGDVAALSIFGFQIYERIGTVRRFLWTVWEVQ